MIQLAFSAASIYSSLDPWEPRAARLDVFWGTNEDQDDEGRRSTVFQAISCGEEHYSCSRPNKRGMTSTSVPGIPWPAVPATASSRQVKHSGPTEWVGDRTF